MKISKRDIIGITTGLLLGAYQPFSIMKTKSTVPYDMNDLITVILFGLIAPPSIALFIRILSQLKKQTSQKRSQYLRHLSNHINFIFLLISYGIATALVGFIYHMIVGLPEYSIIPIAFLGSGGFGFFLANLINPSLKGISDESA